MNTGYAILLGIVQGLTEFLPVSSSAHLVIAQSLLPGFRQPGILFDTVLHMGTLLAVIFFLRCDIYSLLRALLPEKLQVATPDNAAPVSVGRKMILNLIIATVITGIIGISFKSEVERLFSSVTFSAFMLIITGGLLFAAGRMTKNGREEDISLFDSIIIGIAQGLAILPGISRSGATITFGIFRGLKGETAARFSFLLSIPAVMGAIILESRHISLLSLPDMEAYLIGFAAAAVTGLLSLKLLFLIIKKWRLTIFAYYCWLLGLSVLLILSSGL